MAITVEVLVVGDSPVLPTGTAETLRLIFGGLCERYPGEYEVQEVALRHFHAIMTVRWTLHATKVVRDGSGRRVLDIDDVIGQKTSRDVQQVFKPDIVFAFNDPQNLEFLCVPANQRDYKLVLYVNFDGIPTPPDFECLARADRIVTMPKRRT